MGNLLKQVKIISNPLTTHLPRHQISRTRNNRHMPCHCTNHRTIYWSQNLLLPDYRYHTTLLQMEKDSTNIQPETTRQEYENTTQTNRDEDNEKTTQTIQKHTLTLTHKHTHTHKD